MITVRQHQAKDPYQFEVQVSEGGSQTSHRVTMSEATWRTLTGGRVEPQACIHAAFRFLLEREPKESILSSFDVTVISRYFPSFEKEFEKYLDAGPG